MHRTVYWPWIWRGNYACWQGSYTWCVPEISTTAPECLYLGPGAFDFTCFVGDCASWFGDGTCCQVALQSAMALLLGRQHVIMRPHGLLLLLYAVYTIALCALATMVPGGVPACCPFTHMHIYT